MQRRDFLGLMTGVAYAGLISKNNGGFAAWETPTPRQSVPLIYCTDLFHPPDDPDDHVDLATLFSLPELDVRAIVLDLGHHQQAKPGDVPLKQMAALTGKQVPFAPGLLGPLRYPEDRADNQDAGGYRAIELILRTLRESDQKVFVFTTGSVRDVAAAFNRDEALFRAKVGRLYLVIGDSSGAPSEWNTLLDPQAYIRMMSSDLPVYWCPCFGPGAREALLVGNLKPQQYSTYWKFLQRDVYDGLPRPLQNFFLYALGRKIRTIEDPIEYLRRVPEEGLKKEIWNAPRNMWTTGALIHASGRQFYRQGDVWAALDSPLAGVQPSPVFDFVPAKVTIDREMKTTLDVSGATGKFRVFNPLDLGIYERAMTTALRRLLAEMPIVKSFT